MDPQWGGSAVADNERLLLESSNDNGHFGLVKRRRDIKKRGVELLVSALREVGVSRVFGLPGGAISPFNDALLDTPEIEVVVTRHEAEAAFAACGHAIVTGEVGVVFVTSGPGLTNAITGIASAYCDGVPIVVLVGEVPRPVQGKGALQDGSAHQLNIRAMVDHISKDCWEAADANSLGLQLRRAVTIAQEGKKGPVTLILPLDVQTASTSSSSVVLATSMSTPVISRDQMNDIAMRLARARRPLIFAGNGLRSAAGAAALLRCAEHLQMPVMTTPKGKGVFPESHPLSLGVFGMAGHVSSKRYLAEGVDAMLALGTSFGDLATEGWSQAVYPSRSLIHVDIDGATVSRNYAADVAVIGPAELVLDQLRTCLPRCPRAGTYGVERSIEGSAATSTSLGRISPVRALWELQRVLPRDTIYTIDSGEHFVFATHCLEIDQPDAFIAMTGLGSMGQSIGTALGAQLAKPDRTVVVIIGDGGFTMIGTQILDAVAQNAPLIVVVMNDEALRMCEIGHAKVYGRVPSYATPPMDIVGFAQACGAAGLLISKPGEILENAHRLLKRRTPIVLDIHIDPAVVIEKTDRVKSMAHALTRRDPKVS